MINYIRSEFYRIKRTKSLYISMGVILAMLAFAIYAATDVTREYGMGVGMIYASIAQTLGMCTYMVIWIMSCAQGDEGKYHIFKSSISSGSGRGVIFFGRFIAEIVTCIISYIIINLFIILMTSLMAGDFDTEAMSAYCMLMIKQLPVLIAMAAVVHTCYIVFKNSLSAVGVSYFILSLMPQIATVVGMKYKFISKLREFSPMRFLEATFDADTYRVVCAWEIGNSTWEMILTVAIYFIGALVVGYAIMRKKDIK